MSAQATGYANGVVAGVVATYVFHCVLFGVLARHIGLGQLFLDLASTVAGRYSGGQITPPVLRAAALLMIEFLALPYQTIVVAAA